MKLALLWFASWKNSMSSYAPEWVKVDYRRFPRSRDRDDTAIEILSPFSKENATADAKAFAALMRHIRKIDTDHTVIMVQPENEIGMVDHARDYSATATEAYHSEVPEELIDYLTEHRNSLTPELLDAWSRSEFATSGSWKIVFGDSPQAEEIFMAWHFAAYTERVTKAGKAEHP
ncbi:hypothetical protein QEH53_23835, partial [Pelagicoccus sp. SDUM812002]|nr:hypothetical protein [Pelagicoccus sp. SDUM812002]